MFVVMGATGHVGSAVAETLLAKGEAVTILTRHPERATWWRDRGAIVTFADAEDPQSLRSAFEVAKRAFLLNPPADPKTNTGETELLTIGNILSVLPDTGLEKVVAASTYGAQPGQAIGDFTTLWELEEGLRTLPVPSAINRGAYYMSNWLAFADVARTSGILPSMFPADAQIPMVAPSDLGKIAAERLLSSPTDTDTIYVEGPQRYTPRDVASAFSEALRRKVELQVVPRNGFVDAFKDAGFSAEAAQAHARMTSLSIDNDFDKPSSPIRGKVGLQEFVSKALLTSNA